MERRPASGLISPCSSVASIDTNRLTNGRGTGRPTKTDDDRLLLASAPRRQHPNQQARTERDSHNLIRMLADNFIAGLRGGDGLFLQAFEDLLGLIGCGLQSRSMFARLSGSMIYCFHAFPFLPHSRTAVKCQQQQRDRLASITSAQNASSEDGFSTTGLTMATPPRPGRQAEGECFVLGTASRKSRPLGSVADGRARFGISYQTNSRGNPFTRSGRTI